MNPDDTVEIPGRKEPEPLLPPGASSLVEVDLAGLSHPGRVRKSNEDHFIATRFDRTMRLLASNLPEGALPRESAETAYAYLVADGVGGEAAGEIASRSAVQALMGLVLETPDWIMRLDELLVEEVLERMELRFRQVREVLLESVEADPELRGMATTMTVACTLGPDLLLAHVGDSRAYVLRRSGALERLTRDQTMAQSLADAGAISQADAEKHPGRHILTSALATRGAFIQVELSRSRLEDGDRLLLCSDGLTDMVTDEMIARVLGSIPSSAAACRELVELANEAGGKDNVTVVVGSYRIPSGASA